MSQKENKGGGFKGLTDHSVEIPKNLTDFIPGGNLKMETQAQQYDNPRGYPGLAGLQLNRKMGSRIVDHSIEHTMENEGELARTGKPK